MHVALEPLTQSERCSGVPQFAGLRMGGEEFLSLPDDGCRYELVDGVVVMSPSAPPPHQKVAREILFQMMLFTRTRPLGEAFMELDVCLGPGPDGRDLVYRPDVIFVSADRVRHMTERIAGPPELVVEVISRGSRPMDTITKRQDYERLGVLEYWIVDPERKAITFLRRVDGAFAEIAPEEDSFASTAVPGFVLDLKPVRAAFEPWK